MCVSLCVGWMREEEGGERLEAESNLLTNQLRLPHLKSDQTVVADAVLVIGTQVTSNFVQFTAGSKPTMQTPVSSLFGCSIQSH